MVDSDAGGAAGRAVDRSIADARARSAARLTSFVNAARALAEENTSADFTVQQVVERSGLSLKSFYRLFESKDDLFLAVIEADSQVGAALLAEMIGAYGDPVERVRTYVDGLFSFLSADGVLGYVQVLIREQRRLREVRPDEMQAALEPFVGMLQDALADAMQAGRIRPGDARKDAQMIWELVLADIHAFALGREARTPNELAHYMWEFCWAGLEPRAAK
ncbi:MAG: hypothetical protein JJLCMIEE_00254 [Acidimicrobiales bacterium]|nr:MAG: TetR/AcrR family transcriptional regulator [Actinomycetota bacterium]MBV6507213.1 hypothetical protein [Acidimicrobiales bacterium]RIK05501.1 MAG: hypothetical protein DCC48_09390 [Acidobacteriota bacterium]